MKNENNFSALKDEFDESVIEYRTALRTAKATIESVSDYAKSSMKRSPFGSIDERLKEFESVVKKCHRRGYELNMESIRRNVRDIAGIRIIVPVRKDIYSVVEILHHIPGLNIDSEKDYVKNPKPNGYRSYHLGVLVEIYSPITGGSKLVPIEIQVRSKFMDAWATSEHRAKYKNDNPGPEVEAKFKRAAEVLDEIEDIVEDLYGYDDAE